jgi:uncharacterized repeat protein (TIGR03803 family)
MSRYASAIGVVAALLSGCVGSQLPIGAPSAMQLHNASSSPSYQILYSFHARPDGAFPMAGMIADDGVLYGTTPWGGKFTTGTAFSLTTTGAEQVVHAFRPRDGKRPIASMLDANGILYGTTKFGGKYREGVVFKIGSSGREKVLHSFGYNAGGNSDGAYPTANLIDVNGTLYGTTAWGGSQASDLGDGTVFSISTKGNETVLHRFTGTDGAHPSAGLIAVNGALYGTTSSGGKFNDGTIFSMSTSGKENVLHSFGKRFDGVGGPSSLIDLNGTLYRVTELGGAFTCNESHTVGCGTIFSVTTSGAEKVLYSFGARDVDGRYPEAPLIAVNDILYGTTSEGGTGNVGTVFSITTTGVEQILHSFIGGPADGGSPEAALCNLNGTLYGTTNGGGPHRRGTVFALTL